MDLFKNCVPGLQWPSILEPNGALMASLQYQFEQTEQLTAEEIRSLQFKQAEALLYIAKRSVPFYKDRLPQVSGQLTEDIWRDIPVLTRDQLVDAKEKLVNQRPLKGHEQLNKITSSGSTGIPVTAYGTPITRMFWNAFTLREHLWQKRDFAEKLVSIRPEVGEPGQPQISKSWGGGAGTVYVTGPGAAMNSRTDIEAQLQWLQRENPGYLLSLPSNLNELAKLCIERNISLPNLKQIRCYGELLTEAVKERCRQAWGVPISDVYSAQEVGYIAMQCSEHGSYHVQSESLLVEILDENDQPCMPGEIGRVVVTTLLNFGAPLIRYALGDYARLGQPCKCGRGLPVIEKILGRQRNMMRAPNGKVHWPSFPSDYWSNGKIRQLQLVQDKPDSLIIRLVVNQTLNQDEELKLKAIFCERFEYPFKCVFDYVDEIPRSKSGKYEDFICQVN